MFIFGESLSFEKYNYHDNYNHFTEWFLMISSSVGELIQIPSISV